MAEWTTKDVWEMVRFTQSHLFSLGHGRGHGPDERAEVDRNFADWLAARDAEIRSEERKRILGGLLRLPITRTQAWDRGWYSVSITDAISVVRDECCNGRDPGYEGTCPLPLNHQGGCFGDPWVDA